MDWRRLIAGLDFADMGMAFMDAPLTSTGWHSALSKLAEGTGSARAQLIAFGHNHAVPFNVLTDMPDRWMEDFIAIDGGNPLVNWRIACAGRPLQVASEHDYQILRSQLNSADYDDFTHHYGMANGCQTVLSQSSDAFFGLATLRTDRDGQTDEEQRLLFAQVAPFVLAAVKMQTALEHKGAELVADVFEEMNLAAFLLDARGNVMTKTASADAFLSQTGAPLRLSRQRLMAEKSAEDRLLQRAIADALGGLDRPVSEVWLSGDRLMDGHPCEVFRLPMRDWSFGFEPRVLITVRLVGNSDRRASALLRDTMNLTPAEADVGRMLSEGFSREEIAHQRGTAVGTVQAQFKSLFRKADVNRESELVALLNRLLR